MKTLAVIILCIAWFCMGFFVSSIVRLHKVRTLLDTIKTDDLNTEVELVKARARLDILHNFLYLLF